MGPEGWLLKVEYVKQIERNYESLDSNIGTFVESFVINLDESDYNLV